MEPLDLRNFGTRLISYDHFLRGALALLPVLLFLAALWTVDSYKLVPRRMVLSTLAAGGASAIFCYAFNSLVFHYFPETQAQYARWGAPAVEELSKAAFWIFLIATARVAFLVDSAICGFAIGAGFALIENVFFLQALNDKSAAIWVLRGFGTAIMHGGVAAIAAVISAYLLESRQWRGVALYAPGLLVAIALHSIFNQGLISPVASMTVAVAGLPILLGLVFYFSEQSLRKWLGGKMDEDIDLISTIASPEFQHSRAGLYLASLSKAFPPEICGDMLSMLQLTTELSMRSKSDLLFREAGIELPPDAELAGQLTELKFLEKSIGPTGMVALRPLLAQTPRDLWEMHHLGKAKG